MRKFLLAAIASALLVSGVTATPAAASEAQGRVTRVYVMNNGVAMFHLDAPLRTGLPACAVNLPTRWAFDANTPAGQAKLSLILTAYSLGKEIRVIGWDGCPDWGDTESVNWMYTI